MLWGYAGIWPGQFGVGQAQDPCLARLEFLIQHGFRSGGISLTELDDPARRDRVRELVAEHDLRLVPHLGLPWQVEEPDVLDTATDRFLTALDKHRDLLRVPIVAFCAGHVHRFMTDFPLEEQLDRLAGALTPLAAECQALGCPLGIENHVDYYVSDLVELCQRVPHLGIFLDTGNCFALGEKPVPAACEAAPYVVGTHFKDHLVYPDEPTLTFHVTGAVLGSGHVGLAEIYQVLLAVNPAPERLVMHWELVPPMDMDPFDALAESWSFVRSLPGCDGSWESRR
ncbi:MAG: sugar phosphate isomerase/epimerase [Armatimonadetes bacterium]|nr:sugar phosphate isomerase/epimerase [Armatimonadota bacterium]